MRKLAMIPAAMILSLVLIGCESKVSLEHYERIEEGMTLNQVEAILGSGRLESAAGTSIGADGLLSRAKEDPNRQTYVWEDGNKVIIVNFNNGQVASKSRMGF